MGQGLSPACKTGGVTWGWGAVGMLQWDAGRYPEHGARAQGVCSSSSNQRDPQDAVATHGHLFSLLDCSTHVRPQGPDGPECAATVLDLEAKPLCPWWLHGRSSPCSRGAALRQAGLCVAEVMPNTWGSRAGAEKVIGRQRRASCTSQERSGLEKAPRGPCQSRDPQHPGYRNTASPRGQN